ncbi:fused nickel transport protein NikMN [bacterium BMS3Abin10]|nr:fused nickel transport protein NikMN [bacterium BMS3Abin10]GBE38491.1 fused nickel transport protein NikMN [bacterium BMS3Bbin08]HDH51511.1 cobalamin biosynthesis protein CbiM [Nitrospirota bacterium]
MHMADALLSPGVGTTFWAGSLGVIGYCAKKLRENINEKMIPLMGILAAFIFAAQMINFTIPGTGSSGHIGGGMILVIILGPYAAFIAVASVLTVQCLFFADGGILALGCNIWNMAVYPCFIAYPLIYAPLTKGNKTPGRIMIASILSVVVALEFGALSVVLQTMFSGKTELPFTTFLVLMLPIHFAIAIGEGFITGGFVNYIRVIKPEVLDVVEGSRAFSVKKVLVSIGIVAIITGGMLSWFASTHPDGLEWSIERVYGKAVLPGYETGIIPDLRDIQEKTAILPDYNFPAGKEEKSEGAADSWPAVNAGTSFSGIIGSLMVLGLVFILGFGINAVKSKRRNMVI